MKNSFEPSLCGFLQPFQPATQHPAPGIACYWFIFLENKLLLQRHSDQFQVPFSPSPPLQNDRPAPTRCIGVYGTVPCMLLALDDENGLNENLDPINVREAYSHIQNDFWIIAGRASQILRWEQDHRYCGRCGSAMFEPDEEMIKKCPDCSFSAYPRISPAVIMLVTRGREILLGRSPRFPNGMYSTLAGFVEPGETAEEAVRREVREETGIEVNDIRYVASQSWPFPHSLMLAFTAKYASGEITVDNVELEDAKWFSAGDMPRLPSNISVARKLIELFISAHPA